MTATKTGKSETEPNGPTNTRGNVLDMAIVVRSTGSRRNAFLTPRDVPSPIVEKITDLASRNKGRGMGIAASLGSGKLVWITAESRGFLAEQGLKTYRELVGRKVQLSATEDGTSVTITKLL